jgi:hypothetical protein
LGIDNVKNDRLLSEQHVGLVEISEEDHVRRPQPRLRTQHIGAMRAGTLPLEGDSRPGRSTNSYPRNLVRSRIGDTHTEIEAIDEPEEDRDKES